MASLPRPAVPLVIWAPALRLFWNQMGRLLIGAGILLVAMGFVVLLGERIGIHLGRLPGDIRIEGRRGGFYFPIVTCLLVSVVLSLVAWLFSRR